MHKTGLCGRGLVYWHYWKHKQTTGIMFQYMCCLTLIGNKWHDVIPICARQLQTDDKTKDNNAEVIQTELIVDGKLSPDKIGFSGPDHLPGICPAPPI